MTVLANIPLIKNHQFIIQEDRNNIDVFYGVLSEKKLTVKDILIEYDLMLSKVKEYDKYSNFRILKDFMSKSSFGHEEFYCTNTIMIYENIDSTNSIVVPNDYSIRHKDDYVMASCHEIVFWAKIMKPVK